MKSRNAAGRTFTTHDGQELHYRAWPSLAGPPKGAIVLLHRGHEHSGRMTHLAHELNLPDFAFFAWDARGHGATPGERGFSPGIATSIRDVQTFIDHIAEKYRIPVENMIVIGQSVGAVLAVGWAMITPRKSAAWCSPPRHSKSNSMCPSRDLA